MCFDYTVPQIEHESDDYIIVNKNFDLLINSNNPNANVRKYYVDNDNSY